MNFAPSKEQAIGAASINFHLFCCKLYVPRHLVSCTFAVFVLYFMYRLDNKAELSITRDRILCDDIMTIKFLQRR